MPTSVLHETNTNNQYGDYTPRLPDSPEIQIYNERYMCGNAMLPIAKERERIVQTILDNQVTIITTTTGGGKSTQIPQFLAETGKFNKIYVTQPRILACRTLYERVQEEMTTRLGEAARDMVGYRTAEEGITSPENIIEFCTDGLQLMRELTDSGIGEGDILVLDEIHEWNANMSLLAALAKRNNIKLVVMSATMDCDGLSKYYTDKDGEPAPIIKVEGRTYPVEERTGGTIVNNAISYAAEKKNILIFVPGKPEIERTIAELKGRLPKDYPIFGLHSEQSQAEQNKIFGTFESGKIIVSTSIAQTSITIPDLDVVLSCGWQRMGLARSNDVKALAIEPITFSTHDQQKGRVGRNKPGIHHTAQLTRYPDISEITNRDLYGVPDLLKNRLDSVVLKFLGNKGLQLSEIEFYDEPDEEKILSAKRRLQRIGAIAIDGSVTEIGINMAVLPLDIHQARMVVESRKYDENTRRMLIAAIAAHADGGITKTDQTAIDALDYLSDEQESDILQMLDVLVSAQAMTDECMEKNGIVTKKYHKALLKYEQILEREDLTWEPIERPNNEQRNNIIKCIIAGSDELFLPIRRRGHIDNRGRFRRVHLGSPARRAGTMVMGSPFDLGYMTTTGARYSNHIRGATAVDTKLLFEAAPQRCSFEHYNYITRPDGTFAQEAIVLFDNLSTGDTIILDTETTDEVKDAIIEQLILDKKLNFDLPNMRKIKQVINKVIDLQDRVAFDIGLEGIIDDIITESQQEVSANVANIYDLDAQLPTPRLSDYIDLEQVNSIYANTPDTLVIDDEEINVYYRNGNAYATLPSTVDIDKIASYAPLIKAELYVRYPQYGSRFHSLDKISKIIKNGPRRQRRKNNTDEDNLSEPFKQKDKYRRDKLANKAQKIAFSQISSKQPVHAGQRR